MSVLLIVVGAIVLVAGVGTIGFGIPINEFSFGNTLIEAGTTAAIGGLVLIGLGAVVAQLQRVADGLAMWTPTRPGVRMTEAIEPAASGPASVAARPSFRRRPPAKPEAKPDAKPEVEPTHPVMSDRSRRPEPATAQGVSPPAESTVAAAPAERPSTAPSLHNPDVPPVETADAVSLSPVQPQTSQAPESLRNAKSEPLRATPRPSFGLSGPRPSPPPFEAPPPAAATPPPPSSDFDDMWPAFEPKSGQGAVGENGKAEPTFDRLPPRPPEQEPANMADRPQSTTPTGEPPRAVAILKSGVVDGMGYTLYVDGSIEAELPQGTLRFSSINDLRNYLEKNA